MFVCMNELCKNYNVEYYWEQPAPEWVECGGCQSILMKENV